MDIKLDKYTVKLKEELNWGDKETIKAALIGTTKATHVGAEKDMGFSFDGKQLLEAKYITVECCIEKILDEKGEKREFTREWMNNLSSNEGDKIMDAVDKISKKNTILTNVI